MFKRYNFRPYSSPTFSGSSIGDVVESLVDWIIGLATTGSGWVDVYSQDVGFGVELLTSGSKDGRALTDQKYPCWHDFSLPISYAYWSKDNNIQYQTISLNSDLNAIIFQAVPRGGKVYPAVFVPSGQWTDFCSKIDATSFAVADVIAMLYEKYGIILGKHSTSGAADFGELKSEWIPLADNAVPVNAYDTIRGIDLSLQGSTMVKHAQGTPDSIVTLTHVYYNSAGASGLPSAIGAELQTQMKTQSIWFLNHNGVQMFSLSCLYAKQNQRKLVVSYNGQDVDTMATDSNFYLDLGQFDNLKILDDYGVASTVLSVITTVRAQLSILNMISSLSNDMGTLETTVTGLGTTINTLSASVSELDSAVDNVSDDVTNLDGVVMELGRNTTSSLDSLDRRVTNLEGQSSADGADLLYVRG